MKLETFYLLHSTGWFQERIQEYVFKHIASYTIKLKQILCIKLNSMNFYRSSVVSLHLVTWKVCIHIFISRGNNKKLFLRLLTFK
jgi:hypothetical protein